MAFTWCNFFTFAIGNNNECVNLYSRQLFCAIFFISFSRNHISVWMLMQFNFFCFCIMLGIMCICFRKLVKQNTRIYFAFYQQLIGWSIHSHTQTNTTREPFEHVFMFMSLAKHWYLQSVSLSNAKRNRICTHFAGSVHFRWRKGKALPLNVAWLAIYVHVVFPRWVTYGLRVCLKRYNHRWKWSWILNEFPK